MAYDSYKYPRRGSPHPAYCIQTYDLHELSLLLHSILTFLCGGSHVNVNAIYACPSFSAFCPVTRKIFHSIVIHHAHIIILTSRPLCFRIFVHARFTPFCNTPIPPIPHYYNWRRPCSYCNYCALSLFALSVRSFALTLFTQPIMYNHLYYFVCGDPVSSRAPISNTNDHDLMSKTYNPP